MSPGSSGAARQTPNGFSEDARPLRSLASELLRRVVFPVYQRRQMPSAFRYLRELRRLEFASSEAIQKLQWERLTRLLRHAAVNVPYYRDCFGRQRIAVDEIRSTRDFARIPILSKTTLQEHSAALLAETGDTRVARKTPAAVPRASPSSFIRTAFIGNTRAPASGSSRVGGVSARESARLPSGAAIVTCPCRAGKNGCRRRSARYGHANAFAITEQRLEDFAKMLMTWRPRFVTGYASALELFSRFLLSGRTCGSVPLAVKSTAEVLTAAQRSLLGTAFECPVYNFYGSREVNNLAAEYPGSPRAACQFPGPLYRDRG